MQTMARSSRFDFTVKGQEALKSHFRGYLEMLGIHQGAFDGQICGNREYDLFRGDQWRPSSAWFKVYDAFVLRGWQGDPPFHRRQVSQMSAIPD